MANVSRKLGAIPVKHLNGSPYNGQANIYEIAVGDTTPTFVGDFVKMSTDAATDVYPTVIRYAASGEVTSGPIVGAIVGFVISPTNLNTPQFRAASTKRFALVADAPDLIFEIEDGGTVPLALANIGLNTGVQCTAGNTTTGVSNMTTGATAPTTTDSLPLKTMGFVTSPDNETAAAAQKLLVMINDHYYSVKRTAPA